jgi:hypothetical protein
MIASTAHAAVTLTYEQTANGTSGITTSIADGSKLKVERMVRSRLKGVMIYDAARMELTTFDPEKGTYRMLTEAHVKQLERSGTQGPPDVRFEKVGT